MAVYAYPSRLNVIECHLLLDPSSLRILIKGLLRSLLIIESNLASTQALACSDEILDTVGVFAR
jgi:hypothetical protein